MSGLHTRDLEIPSVTGVSVHQGVTAAANEMDVTDGGLGQHQRGWRTVVQSQHERGGVQKQGEWMNGGLFKRENGSCLFQLSIEQGTFRIQ